MNRRSFVQTVGAGVMSGVVPLQRIASAAGPVVQEKPTAGRLLTIEAKPAPLTVDTAKTAVIVVDMQNDFGAEGGMFHRAGIDISMIRAAVAPTKRVLSVARDMGIKVIQSHLSEDGISFRSVGRRSSRFSELCKTSHARRWKGRSRA